MARLPHILEDGLYYQQLSRYFEIFSQNQIHAILYDELRSEFENVIRGIAQRLRVPFEADSAGLESRANAKKSFGIPHAYKKVLWPLVKREATRRQAVQLAKKTGFLPVAEFLFSRRLEYPELPDWGWDKLRAYYTEDVKRLSELLDRDLRSWLE